MAIYKKVIVAIDMDDGSHDVLKKASTLLSGDDVETTVINVINNDVQMYGGYIESHVFADEEKIRQQVLPKVEDLTRTYDLSNLKLVVDFGRAADVILEHAEEQNADLILLGSHGRHGLGLLLGSTANGVLHRAKCDVLAVRIL